MLILLPGIKISIVSKSGHSTFVLSAIVFIGHKDLESRALRDLLGP